MDSGKVEMFLMGPPCRTVSAARHTEDGGPRPLRSREGDERFGLKGLNHYEKKLVEDDTVLMLRAQWLARKVTKPVMASWSPCWSSPGIRVNTGRGAILRF